MFRHHVARAAVIAAAVVLNAAVLMPAVSAAPAIPSGIGLGSSGSTAPWGPTPGGYGVYTSVEPDLSGLEAGTTWSATYIGGDCVTDPGGRGFFWDSGNGNPFRSCFYDPSTALYRYEVTTPTRQRATVQVRFTSRPTIVPGFASVGASCAGGGNTGCADGSDGAQRVTGAVLTPRPKLGPLPTPPSENYRFCASESLACGVQDGTTVAFGTGTAFVQKVVDGPGVRCTTEQFGGVDPAPGKFKDCFIVR